MLLKILKTPNVPALHPRFAMSPVGGRMSSAYDPLQPAKRPGGRPTVAPRYRVLLHKKFRNHYAQLAERVGIQQARQMWDHLATTPGATSGIASTTILRGRAGRPRGPGWSRTVHYEVSGDARVDYQYHDAYRSNPSGDAHPVVAILTISFGSH